MSSTLADKMVVRYVGHVEVTPAERKKAKEISEKIIGEFYPHILKNKIDTDVSTPQTFAGMNTKKSSVLHLNVRSMFSSFFLLAPAGRRVGEKTVIG